jgi:hypothetical protein
LQLTGSLGLASLLLLTDPSLISVPVERFIQSVPSQIGQPTDLVGTTLDGMVVRQRSVVSKEKVDTLKKHFFTLFRTAGLFMPPDFAAMQGQAGEQVTGLDTENLIAYTAIFQPNPKGTTIVIAAADLGHLPVIKSPQTNGPVYPGATGVTTSSLEGMHVMTYTVEATPAEIKAFYRDAYRKEGYRENGELTFVRDTDKDQAKVVVSPGISARSVMVQTGAIREPSPESKRLEKVDK